MLWQLKQMHNLLRNGKRHVNNVLMAMQQMMIDLNT